MNTIAIESGHWYDAEGNPRYTIVGKNGKERPTTLRDARQLGLLPSVTEILKCAAKPGLDVWKQRQVMLAALTLPRFPDESDDDFCQRVMRDSQEQGRKAADRGSELHGSLERAIQGKPHGHHEHVANVFAAMKERGIDLVAGEAERSFAHALGFGGKCDWHCKTQPAVLDFKSKDRIEGDKKYAWDEHAMQLAAYERGFGLLKPRRFNVFVGVEDARVLIHEWSEDEINRGWEQFLCLLSYWKLSKGYCPEQITRAA